MVCMEFRHLDAEAGLLSPKLARQFHDNLGYKVRVCL